MSSFAQEQAVDPRTRLLMYKMVNAGILENINGCISTGKEAVVFHANGGRCVLCIIVCATRLSLAINASLHLLSNVYLDVSRAALKRRLFQKSVSSKFSRPLWMSLRTGTNISRMTTASKTASASWILAKSSACGLRKRCTTSPGDMQIHLTWQDKYLTFNVTDLNALGKWRWHYNIVLFHLLFHAFSPLLRTQMCV